MTADTHLTRAIDLEFISGVRAPLALPTACGKASCYAFSMEHSGHAQFWQLMTQLLQAAGHSPCSVHDALRSQGADLAEVTRASLRELLCREGYGFGVLFDADPAFDLIPCDSPKLLFLRDPRDMLIAMYRSSLHSAGANSSTRADGAVSTAPSLTEFLQLPMVDCVIDRYQRFLDHWRLQPNVTLLRYEHAVLGWHATAAEVAAALHLSIEPGRLVSIATGTPSLGDQPTRHEQLDEKALTELEKRLTGIRAPLGYASCGLLTLQPTGPPRRGSVAGLAQGANISKLFEHDPICNHRLKPNATAEMHVLGRRVVMDVDPTGCRPVIGQPAKAERMFWVYGCSFTYGTAVPAEETFCSLLQARFRTLRIENHGIPGFSTSRSLLQLEGDILKGRPELVAFCWIEDHLKRNVAAFDWIERLSKNHPPAGARSKRTFPRAALGADAALQIGSVRVPRHDLVGLDLSEYAPDAYYLDLVCLRLLERANAVVTGYGGHFFVTTLSSKLSATLSTWLAERVIPVVNASLNGKQYTCWPDDWHPNTIAQRIYCERIGDYVERRLNRTSPVLGA